MCAAVLKQLIAQETTGSNITSSQSVASTDLLTNRFGEAILICHTMRRPISFILTICIDLHVSLLLHAQERIRTARVEAGLNVRVHQVSIRIIVVISVLLLTCLMRAEMAVRVLGG